jgi:hypothetical protein
LITLLAALIFSLLLLASLALGYLGVGSYGDPFAGVVGRCWSVLAMCVAGSLFITNVIALRFLIRREPAIGSAAVVLFVVALVGLVTLIPAGFAMLTEVGNSGPDYTGLAGVGCFVVGIAFPAVIGVVTMAGGACLILIRRQIQSLVQEQRLR